MTTEKKNQLKIGISCFFQFSVFSNGNVVLALSLADLLEKMGHKAVLINLNNTVEWYDDCNELKDKYERRNLAEWDIKNYDQLDTFIDIDGFLVPTFRRKIGKKVLVFIRKPPVITESENLVYPILGPIRNIIDCDGIITFDHFGSQDAHILELLSEKPIYRIPIFWSPNAINTYLKNQPSWLETSKEAKEWKCRVVESNKTLTSACIIPMVTVSYIKRRHPEFLVNSCIIHNSVEMSKHEFFEQNITNNCKEMGLNYEFVGRQRIADFVNFPKSFIIFHIRFNIIKAKFLDAIWAGIPFIHNSPWLKNFGNGFEKYFYSDNSIREATNALKELFRDYENKDGIFKEGALENIRKNLIEYLNYSKTIDILRNVLSIQNTEKNIQQIVEASKQLDQQQKTLPEDIPQSSKEFVVGISDFHDSFNYTYNFWTLFLQEAANRLKTPMKVKTVEITEKNHKDDIDLLICGPFGKIWEMVPEKVPKVYTTGENSPSKFGNGIFLNLGFEQTDEAKGIFRFPLWLMYIDWFGADQNKLVNPKSMPLDAFTSINKDMIQNKSKFCAFIVTNPYNTIRNDAFNWLSEYKHVDSAGRLFNNVGDKIFTNIRGGGGGELAKMEFLKDYKFCITYENSRGNGYITEKLMAAKAAGCVPIYWGAPNPYEDFAEGSFINANSITTKDELIRLVKEVDENQEKWLSMASKPAIDVEKERKRLADAAKLIFKKVFGETIAEQLPAKLGASSSSEANLMRIKRDCDQKLSKPLQQIQWNGKTLFVTFATSKFIHSLSYWLGTTEIRVKADSNISIRVYIGEDVTDEVMNLIRSEHPSVDIRRIPTQTVKAPDFPDLWEPQHFAWKLWIYQELVQEQSLANTLIWYSDAGSMIVRMPEEWFNITKKEGLCMLEDKEQKNDQWCHPEFTARMMLTPEEKTANQTVGGIVSFIGGSKLAWKVFTEAWVLGQKRNLIVGPKWAGVLPDGRPFGHRHDQSILSVLRLRHKVPVYPLENVYNHESLRRTFKSGAALYVHRGFMKENENFAPRIGEVHIINLSRRNDRIKKFKEAHENWTKNVCLRPAYDGKLLSLSPGLAALFSPNDFHWKKAVMGCALSHLSLWFELAQEPPSCENYLILEDDVVLQKGWLDIWKKASEKIPEDYDVLYLGGVLPPNKEGFKAVQEPINEYWNKIKPNQCFGQTSPTSYFHFCNYAYILSRKGAQKILEEIQRRGGYYTSADHMICNRIDDMKHYILNPQVAGCYQDDDPKYMSSEFNNFNRVDNFDSDLWNNNDRFTEQDVVKMLSNLGPQFRLSIGQVIMDNLYATKTLDIEQTQEKTPEPRKELPPSPTLPSELINKTEEISKNIYKTRFYTVDDLKFVKGSLFEYSWLEEIFGEEFNSIKQISSSHEPLSDTPVFFCMHPHIDNYKQMFNKYEAAQKDFIVVHLSDEVNDDLSFYTLKHCKKIIRSYPRHDIPCLEKVVMIPLGPYRRNEKTNTNYLDRKIIWSFFGTGWNNREKMLEPFKKIVPHELKLYTTWEEQKLNAQEYSDICRRSIFIPCPAGQNYETFRIWEALEHGAIPIYVRKQGDEEYFKFISSKLPIISHANWDAALLFIQSLLHNSQTLINYRQNIIEKWESWKNEIKETCRKICFGI
jgi:alpha(1,3/1,4) fucosyltransferase